MDGLLITMPWIISQRIISTTIREGDELSRCVFHFKDIQELHTVRDGICNANLIPNGFHIPRGLQASGTNNPVPLGQAYLVIKLGCFELGNFVHLYLHIPTGPFIYSTFQLNPGMKTRPKHIPILRQEFSRYCTAHFR
ncbi:unnamed protein product [Rhizophagus irregularis]|nr:unnamed protein product [Rhizophagus irregularis]